MHTLWLVVSLQAEARGGRTLSLLHDAGKHYAIEHKAVDLLVVLIRGASIPYFEALEQWIHTGYVYDPCDEVNRMKVALN